MSESAPIMSPLNKASFEILDMYRGRREPEDKTSQIPLTDRKPIFRDLADGAMVGVMFSGSHSHADIKPFFSLEIKWPGERSYDLPAITYVWDAEGDSREHKRVHLPQADYQTRMLSEADQQNILAILEAVNNPDDADGHLGLYERLWAQAQTEAPQYSQGREMLRKDRRHG